MDVLRVLFYFIKRQFSYKTNCWCPVYYPYILRLSPYKETAKEKAA